MIESTSASWTETGVEAGLEDGGIEGRLTGIRSWKLVFLELLFLLIKEEKNEKGFCYTFVPTPLIKIGLV